MNHRIVPLAILVASFCAIADDPPDFRTRFLRVATNAVEFGLYEANIREWGLENGSWTRNAEQGEIVFSVLSDMSNRVDEAVSMISEVVTNGVQKEILLHMAGHAGTNAFLRVWDGLLDIAETNIVAVSPETVDDYCLASTTPLDCYVVFFHDEPSVHTLLERTRDLFPSNSQKRGWYDRALSGEVESEMRTYLIDSGEGLPWFAQ